MLCDVACAHVYVVHVHVAYVGAVTVLDAVKGVEAQTDTVWPYLASCL